MVEWLKATDCKSVGISYVGSNPTFFIFQRILSFDRVQKTEIRRKKLNCKRRIFFVFFKALLDFNIQNRSGEIGRHVRFRF